MLSRKDHVLGVLVLFSGTLAFALSFTVTRPNGKPGLLMASVMIAVLCLLFATNKTAILVGLLGFIALRLAISLFFLQWQ